MMTLALLGLGLLPLHVAFSPLSVGTPQRTSAPAAGLSLTLAWVPSPSTEVTGYSLNWGLASGQCTNQLALGAVTTNITVSGLTSNTTYYFNIVAHDAIGNQSPPSNELTYLAASAPPESLAPVLLFRALGNGTNATALSISFQGSANATYLIQATQDFQHWMTLWTTNCPTDGPVHYETFDATNYAYRFYRVQRR